MPDAKEDATHAIWQDPASYDYAVHGPPYLKTASGPFDWSGASIAGSTSHEEGRNMSFIGTLLGSDRYPFDELGVLLAYLRGLSMMYQTYHWRAKGDPAYGDHLLFERLYNDVQKDIDGLAERVMGISPAGVSLVDPVRQASQLAIIIADLTRPFEGLPQPSDDVIHALNAEMKFLNLCDLIAKHTTLSRGTDNLVAGLQDRHEANIYLLNQRSQVTQPSADYSR